MVRLSIDTVGDWERGSFQVSAFDIDECVKILISGDLCPIGRVQELLLSGRGYDVEGSLAGVLSNHDLSIFNLECPLTQDGVPNPLSGFNLHAHPNCAVEANVIGFDVATLANNHIMDMGEQGLEDTLAACRMAGLKYVGAGRNITEASRPLILDIKEIRVAIFAFAEHEWSIAKSDTPGACPLDPVENYYQITAARQEADFVLVVLHGGNEHYPLPSPRIVKTCRYFVDIGARAVVCHHSHAASGLEIYHGAPIVYGTGNLLFDWPTCAPETWYYGYMVGLTARADSVISVCLFPYFQCKPNPGVRPMEKNQAKLFFEEIERLSDIITDISRLEASWMEFCDSKRLHYRSMALCLNRVERWLLRIGFRPWWRTSRERVRILHNVIRCESHRDVLVKSLMSSKELW